MCYLNFKKTLNKYLEFSDELRKNKEKYFILKVRAILQVFNNV